MMTGGRQLLYLNIKVKSAGMSIRIIRRKVYLKYLEKFLEEF